MADYDQMGPSSTPGLYLEQTYNQMDRDFDRREAQLADQQLQPDEYNDAIRKMQAEYNDQSNFLLKKKSTLEKTQAMIDSGVLSPQEGMESNWATVLPREVMAARTATMRPPEEEEMGEPFSPSKLEAYGESAAEFGEATAVTRPAKPGRNIKVRSEQSLLRQYKAWRTNIGYDSMDANKQRQVDSEWDSWVGTQKGKWNWDPKGSKVIQALRAKGKLSRGYGAQFRGTPTGPTEGRNPLHDSIAKMLPARSYEEVLAESESDTLVGEGPRTLTREIALSIMQEAGGDKAKARQIAAERGYSL